MRFWRLFLLTLLIPACSGNLAGNVYLDENANNFKDENEPGLGNILFTVTKDGTPFKSGLTALDGSFEIKKEDSGYYCINVQRASPAYSEPGLEPVISTPTSTTTKGMEATTATAGAASNTTTSTTTSTSGTTTNSDSTKDSEKDEPRKPAEETTETVQPPITKPLQACLNITGYSSKAFVDVPVTIDHSVASLPTPKKITLAPGEIAELSIYYPKSCKPLDLPLPEFIVPAKKYLGTNLISLSLLAPDVAHSIKPYTITDDEVVLITPRIKAVDKKLIEKETTAELTPRAICPDNSIVELPKQKVVIKNERRISIIQMVDKDRPEFGDKMTLSTKVLNDGPTDYKKGAVLVIALPEGVDIENTSCRKLPEQVQCDIAEIIANSSKDFEVTFKLPEYENVATNYRATIHTELKFNDGSQAIKVEPDISFTPEAPVPSEE